MNEGKYFRFFTNLSSPLRIHIIGSLEKREKSVSELSKELNVEQSKLSHALSNLRCCKIVNVLKKGKQRIYSLNKKTIVPILKIIDKHAINYCSKSGCSCK